MVALLAGRHAADLAGALGPGLQVLQGEQRAVLQAQRVRGHRLVDGLLEGLLLQLHEDPVGLLSLRLPLLRRLPPANTESRSHIGNIPETSNDSLNVTQLIIKPRPKAFFQIESSRYVLPTIKYSYYYCTGFYHVSARVQ